MPENARPLQIALADGEPVGGLFDRPDGARALYVFAHGAGAGMSHRFMADVAGGLAARGIATLRFDFPFMARGSKRPDPPALAQATVRAAVQEAARLAPELPLIAGGKSFGGRMSSQAQARMPLPGVRGLAFVGFPLHPPKAPSVERAAHLDDVACPMLFLQGTRDALAEPALLHEVVARLGARARLVLLDGADHAFHVLARSGRKDDQVLAELLDAFDDWVDAILESSRGAPA
jgi:predicted alpha/beta-hydrolase family hydrolase